MYAVVQVVGWWVLISCIIGPLLTWLFCRFEREERGGRSSLGETRGEEAVVDLNRWVTSASLRRPS